VKITIDNAEIECTPVEAVELLQRLKARQYSVRLPVPWQGQPERCLPSDTKYRMVIASTYDYNPNVTGDSVHNYGIPKS